MLATLFKDERCQQLPAYSILEKMYLDRIIRRSELEEFESLLQPHQEAHTVDGNSLVFKEHKLLLLCWLELSLLLIRGQH